MKKSINSQINKTTKDAIISQAPLIFIVSLLLGLITNDGFDIFIYTTIGYIISTTILLIASLTILVKKTGRIALSKDKARRFAMLIVASFTVIDMSIPIGRINTNNCSIDGRRNIFNGAITKRDSSEIPFGIDGGVCTQSRYNIYFL